ncbi:MAG TPA: rhodanese-like domain-containing protein [Thermomicrobiales bacterium]|nr:rhodanese-like domain-containing protein [Thermomicrobiales bacterium]
MDGPRDGRSRQRGRRAARATAVLAVALVLLPLLAGCAGSARPPAPTIQVKPVPADRYPHPEYLADTAWLAQHLADPNVRVVDLSSLADYRRGHIPGAVHVWWQDLVEVNNDTYGMLVDPESRKRVIGGAGIRPGMTVAAYDDAGGRYAAYFLWVLTYTDYAAGKLLNGGFDTWRAEGRPVTRDVPAVAPVALPDRPTDEAVLLYRGKDLAPHLTDHSVAIVDTRSPTEGRETWGGLLRVGRIPGALPIPWERNLGQKGTAVVRDPGELPAVYKDIRPDQDVVVYGLTGVDAAQTFWILRVLGYQHVRLYDGSWAEWGALLPGTPFPVEPLAVG